MLPRFLCRCFPESPLSSSSCCLENKFLTLRLVVFTCMEFGIWEMRPGKVVRDCLVVDVVVVEAVL